jgi:hypothetical protein
LHEFLGKGLHPKPIPDYFHQLAIRLLGSLRKTDFRAVSSVVEHCLDTAGVTGSNPVSRTIFLEGIAQPAYGKTGGGVEVIFVDGSPDNTVRGPEEIPER